MTSQFIRNDIDPPNVHANAGTREHTLFILRQVKCCCGALMEGDVCRWNQLRMSGHWDTWPHCFTADRQQRTIFLFLYFFPLLFAILTTLRSIHALYLSFRLLVFRCDVIFRRNGHPASTDIWVYNQAMRRSTDRQTESNDDGMDFAVFVY